MIEDMHIARRIATWLLAAACAVPCLSQQGSASDSLDKLGGKKLDDVGAQQETASIEAADAEQRFAAGDYRGAAAAFGKRLESRREDPALLYNLALSAWRAGDLGVAEDAIDRYAAAPGGGRLDLHHGLLGNIRYQEAESLVRESNGDAQPSPLQPRPAAGAGPATEPLDPIQTLEDAAKKARAARDSFVRAAGDAAPSPEIVRNAERSLRLLQAIETRIEELKKQCEEQQKQEQDQKQDNKDQQNKDDTQQGEPNQKQPDQQQPDQKQQDEQQQDKQQQDQQQEGSDQKDQPPQGKERPEPKPDAAKQEQQQDQQQDQSKTDPAKDAAAPEPKNEGEEKPEPAPKAGEAKTQPSDAQQAPRTDAPGEQVEATELSPEQRARLLEQLKELDQRMREIRRQGRSRRPVDRDW